jgi:hypothetical protein
MDVHVAKLDKKQLAAMPVAERGLLLLLAHANNEINVLSKLILMMRKDDPPSRILDHVEAGQAFILMRLLTGKRRGSCSKVVFKVIVPSQQPICRAYSPRERRRLRR